MKKRLFTKTVFKLATECPTKPFYYKRKDTYGNVDTDNEFLMALAEGGFQIAELAKLYYPNGILVNTYNHKKALEITNNLLKKENVVIFEAAFLYENCFIRVDILEKKGDQINLIEVKSKSFNSNDVEILNKKMTEIRSEWKPYIYDVVFQEWVLRNATNYNIVPYLMLADKSKNANVDSLNQMFQIIKIENGKKSVNVIGDTNNLGEKILTKLDIIPFISYVYKDFKGENNFENTILNWSDAYVNDRKIQNDITDKCFNCQFKYNGDEKKSGFKECINTKFKNVDFSKPMIDEIWNYRGKNNLLSRNILYLEQLKESDIIGGKSTPTKERQLLQVVNTINNVKEPYIERNNLKMYFNSFTYPLHFIDFETSMVAIPFHKGRRPYEQIAFQFSHHIMEKNGEIRHAGEYISDEKGKFPNFEFVRKLKKELENDNGTIFRYAPYENTVLNQISEQLENSNEKDKKELIDFIRTITYNDEILINENGEIVLNSRKNPIYVKRIGERCMVDMLEMVKNCFWSKEMKGSNSIKDVLPAVLNNSKFIQDKYSSPIYGKEIKSLNFKEMVWIKKDKNGNVINPYKLLDNKICNGGEAMTAYAKMQFSNINDKDKNELKNALLRYCELDTLAMVMIFEYWKKNITPKSTVYIYKGGEEEIFLD
jgi:hypothetical protein